MVAWCAATCGSAQHHVVVEGAADRRPASARCARPGAPWPSRSSTSSSASASLSALHPSERLEVVLGELLRVARSSRPARRSGPARPASVWSSVATSTDDVVELRQLLVGAHADHGAQRQAVAIDEVLVAVRLGLVLRRQARRTTRCESSASSATRSAAGRAWSRRSSRGAALIVPVVKSPTKMRVSITQSERSKSRPPVRDGSLAAPAAHEHVGRHRHEVARMRRLLPALRDEAVGERRLVLDAAARRRCRRPGR